MTDSKRYLDVPFSQKDQAKALGAKWDASRKKWFVPPGLDGALFERWKLAEQPMQPGNAVVPKRATATRAGNTKVGDSMVIAVTQPQDKDFVPYSGDAPPWE